MSRIADALVDQWIYDIETLSQGWVLWTLIPAMFYLTFMLIKWVVLTCPVWLPLVIVAKAFKGEDKS